MQEFHVWTLPSCYPIKLQKIESAKQLFTTFCSDSRGSARFLFLYGKHFQLTFSLCFVPFRYLVYAILLLMFASTASVLS